MGGDARAARYGSGVDRKLWLIAHDGAAVDDLTIGWVAISAKSTGADSNGTERSIQPLSNYPGRTGFRQAVWC